MDKDKLTELQEKYPGQQLYIDEEGFVQDENGDFVGIPQWVLDDSEQVYQENLEYMRKMGWR